MAEPSPVDEAPVSCVVLPVQLPLETLRAQLEQLIPADAVPAGGFTAYEQGSEAEEAEEAGEDGKFAPDTQGLEVRYGIARASIDATAAQNELQLGARLLYWLEARTSKVASARCGSASEPIPVRTGWSVRCGWKDGWRIDTQIKILPTTFSLRCKPVPPAVNFTGFLNRKIDERVVLPVAAVLDSLIQAQMDVRPKLEAAWRSLGEPVDLGGVGWLSWRPEAAVLEPIQTAGGTLVSKIGIIARPQITAGDRPASQLPPLPETKVRLAGEHVSVAMRFEVPMEEVQARLARVAPPGAALRASGSGSHVVVTCKQPGAELQLAGDLEYDPATYRLAVIQVDYVSTPNSTATTRQATDFDAQKLRRDIQAALDFDLGQRISTGLVLLGRAINGQLGPAVSMRGGAMEQKVLRTYVDDRAFGLRLAAQGQATLQIDE